MIRILEKEVADKIAAGEVVDKPLSVVKELVENAIDAGATSITVEIQKGGKTYIRVTDNGCGIESGQVELAFMRHATSKISRATDLQTLTTLGFRGEALASIAAVSRTEIITKTCDEKTGIKLLIEGSSVSEKEATGCPEGTTIVVRDLFYNMPARKEFLGSDGAESRAVIEFLSQIALAYVNLKLRVINNGTMLFSTPGKGDRYRTILTVYDKKMCDNLIPVKAKQDYLTLEGYISDPGESRANRKQQIFFVNGRIVDSAVIQRGVAQAYTDKLFEGRFPIAFLFLHCRPDTLEVNIHPHKRQVRFSDEEFVTEFVKKSLRQALLSGEAIPPVRAENLFKRTEPQKLQPKSRAAGQLISPGEGGQTAETVSVKNPAFAGERSHKNSENGHKLPAQDVPQIAPSPEEEQVDIKKLLSNLRQERQLELKEEEKNYEEAPGQGEKALQGGSDASAAKAEIKTPPPFHFDELHIKGTLFGTYIMAADETCFYLIDQHAAHERIFFEHLMEQYGKEEKHRQPIMTPIMLSVPYSVSPEQDEWLKTLEQMGFLAEEFGPKSYAIREIPMFMGIDEAERFLKDFSDSLVAGETFHASPATDKIIMRSCKSAVKAHDYLKDSEIQRLIEDLKKCENPFSCPHGRPTFIKMTQRRIEELFKR
ncbi:MAG: DNA mismatch repair endonuclease MutL [Firmicutes bacterium]|nr:DNA mismatch repair endonuclease MutL [Bacillota bacterium]